MFKIALTHPQETAEVEKQFIPEGAEFEILHSPTEEDPDLNNSKLVGRDNVILTPHIAYYSKTSQYEIEKRSAQNIGLYLDGKFDELN